MAFKFRMSENSLFAILLRSRWWVSLLVAAGLFALGRLFIPAAYAIFLPLPFLVIATIAGWRQFQAPSQKRIDATLDSAREMSWETFSTSLAEGYRREGFTVTPVNEPGADLLVERAARTALVAARRFKAARTGVEPLQALQRAREKRDVHDAVFVSTGELSAQAQAYCVKHQIRVAQGPELLKLLGGSGRR